MRRWRFRRTTLIIAFSVAIVLGVASAGWISFFAYVYLCFSLAVLLVFAKHRNLTTLLILLLLGILLGNWRGSVVMRQLNPLAELYDQHVVLTATAQSDGIYSNNSQISFDVGNIKLSDPERINIPGRIKIEGFGANAVYRGDVVEVEGKLRDTLGSRQGRIGFAQIKVVGRSDGVIGEIRHNFSAGVFSALPEPQASFGLGLLIGEKNTLPKKVTDNLAAVGLTHIIAVSGYNLTIIVTAARRLLAKRSKYQAALFSALLVTAFVLLTGFSASIVRASIVSMLSIVAWYYGRAIRPVLLITFTAAITSLWNPIYVWSDAGWYLSFLAFFGVLVVSPLLIKRFSFANKKPGVAKLLITESLCAQLMTLPYILYTFERLPLLSLPANLVVVPLVPVAMLLSMIAGLAGMFATTFAGWFAWPAKLILTYILDVAGLFARIPRASMQSRTSIAGLALLYGCILVIVLVLSRTMVKRDTITDRNSVNPRS